MLKNNLNSLEDFISNVHKLGYQLVELGGDKVPCVLVDPIEFEKIMNVVHEKPSTIDTNLNIFDDGYHVFVNINIKIINTIIEFDFLLYANETLEFFKALSLSGMIGLFPHGSSGTNVFFVQLPRKDQAIKAYDMILSKVPKVP